MATKKAAKKSAKKTTKKSAKKGKKTSKKKAFAEPPITIKGGSPIKVRYGRGSFDPNPADGDEHSHRDGRKRLEKLVVIRSGRVHRWISLQHRNDKIVICYTDSECPNIPPDAVEC